MIFFHRERPALLFVDLQYKTAQELTTTKPSNIRVKEEMLELRAVVNTQLLEKTRVNGTGFEKFDYTYPSSLQKDPETNVAQQGFHGAEDIGRLVH